MVARAQAPSTRPRPLLAPRSRPPRWPSSSRSRSRPSPPRRPAASSQRRNRSTARPSWRTASPSCSTSAPSICPHCAAERWPLYIALSKFGTFNPQPGRIHSANLDGDVPTLTFYGTTYSSPYLTFTPVEVDTNKPQGNGYAPLQTPTQAQLTLWQDTNGGTFPFVDFGGKKVLPSAQYLFTPLENLPFSTVAAQVGDNSTAIGSVIDASAAQLITTICGSLSHDRPADVCSAVHGG